MVTITISKCKDAFLSPAILFAVKNHPSIPLKCFLEPTGLFYKFIHLTNIYRFLKEHRKAETLKIIASACQVLTGTYQSLKRYV